MITRARSQPIELEGKVSLVADPFPDTLEKELKVLKSHQSNSTRWVSFVLSDPPRANSTTFSTQY